jgi:transposase
MGHAFQHGCPFGGLRSGQGAVRTHGSLDFVTHRAARQAKALIWATEGVPNAEIARRCGVDPDAVRAWRRRFEEKGLGGVGVIAKGRGRRSWLPDGTVAEVLRVTKQALPADGATQWSTRSLAAHMGGVGKDTVARIWRDHEVKPWKVDRFKISNDPRFEEKLVDVVGLYMDPPKRAVLFSFDEKTQVQALDRTQPSLPLRPGRAGTLTHDYKRNGTIDLFAALNVATGEVITECRQRHTSADVLAFFKLVDRAVPRGLSVHVVLDNLSAHMGPEVEDWLSQKRQARWHLHFVPTSSSWLNLVWVNRPPAPAWRVHQRRCTRRSPERLGQELERRPEAVRLT